MDRQFLQTLGPYKRKTVRTLGKLSSHSNMYIIIQLHTRILAYVNKTILILNLVFFVHSIQWNVPIIVQLQKWTLAYTSKMIIILSLIFLVHPIQCNVYIIVQLYTWFLAYTFAFILFTTDNYKLSKWCRNKHF